MYSQVLRRHLAYEADWHLPDGSPLLGLLLHLLHVACWLFLFQPVYPMLELAYARQLKPTSLDPRAQTLG